VWLRHVVSIVSIVDRETFLRRLVVFREGSR